MIRLIYATVFCLALVAGRSEAIERVWDGGGGDFSWSNPANWSPDGVPSATDDVIIDVPETQITVTFNTTSTVNSLHVTNILSVVAGTLTINDTSTIDGLLTLHGTLIGTGDLIVNGTMNWPAGNGPVLGGPGKVIIGRSGTLSKYGAAFLSRSIDNHGVINSNASWIASNIVINNLGLFTWNVGVAASFTVGSPCVFNNLGTFIKNGMGGSDFQANTSGTFAFNNSGICRVAAGGMRVGKGSHSGTFEIVAQESILEFGHYGCNLAATSTVTGAGTMWVNVHGGGATELFVSDGTIDLDGNLLLDEGSPTFNGPVAVRGILKFGFDSSQTYNATFNGSVDLLPTGRVETPSPFTTHFNGPSIDLAGSLSRGTFHFANDVVISRQFTLDQATLLGPGKILVSPSGEVVTDTPSLSFPLRMNLENHGQIAIGADGLAVMGPASIVNHGLMTVEVANESWTFGIVGAHDQPGVPSFINHGQFVKTGPGRINFGSLNNPLLFTNEGNLQVEGGYADIYQLSNHSGEIEVGVGGQLTFHAPSIHAIDSQITVDGILRFESALPGSTHDLLGLVVVNGTLEVQRGIVTLHNAISSLLPVRVMDLGVLVTNVNQSWPAGLHLASEQNGNGGTITGEGDIELGGTSIFRGKMSGTGTTTIMRAATVTTVSPNGGAGPTLGRRLVNHGTFHWSVAGAFRFESGTFENHGSFLVNTSSSTLAMIGVNGTPRFANHGVFTKSGAASLELLHGGAPMPLENHGQVSLLQGTLRLDSGASGAGTVDISTGATIRANSNCAGGSIVNNGTVSLAPQKRLTLSGSYDQSSTGRLMSTILAAQQPLISTQGPMTIGGRIELLMTPLPTETVSVPILDAGVSSITGMFTQTVLQPQGQLRYMAGQVEWHAHRPGDVDGGGVVDVQDLLAVVGDWGLCPAGPVPCPTDMNADGVINVLDLLAVVTAWS